jgi:lauroyl/myristoyl acyltransferase
MSAKDVTFVLTSCSRFDLLAETLETFLRFNTYPIAQYVLVEDSGNDGVYDVLRHFRPKFRVILNDPPVGQIASIDKAYAGLQTPYIFHCEDDWRFFRTGLIEESIILLESIPEIVVVSGRHRGQKPDFDFRFFDSRPRSYNGIGYRCNEREPDQVWGGYTFNPGLRRLVDYRRLGSFAAIGHEAQISRWFLARGMNVAHLEKAACETIGEGRHLVDPFRTDHRRRSASLRQRTARRIEFATRELAPASRKRFSPADARFLTELPVLWFAARFLPEAKWHRVSHFVERVKTLLGDDKVKRRTAKVALALRLPAGDGRAGSIARATAARRTEHHLQVLKEAGSGWNANIDLQGDNELRSALAAGKGAVLWVAHTAFNALATKMALHRAGYVVSHISRPEHGFSKSRFGIRFLNPIRWRAETKYLRDRIVIDRSHPGGAFARAAAELRGNGIVSVTAGAWEGRYLAHCELFRGRMTLATGAPKLAHETGARLLPVFTAKAGDGVVVRIGPAIEATSSLNREAVIQHAVREFVDELRWLIRQYPDQWRGWDDWEPPPGSSDS